MSVVDRYHDVRREADTATAQAMDTLQLALTALVEVPRYIEADQAHWDDPRASLDPGPEDVQLRRDREEILRLARLYADPRLLENVAVENIIARLSEGLA